MENQPGYGAATVRLDPRGKVHVFGGDAPGGQGHETTTAQVVASAFGISPNDVVVTIGDTGTTPFGSGSIGGRAGSYFASAVAKACTQLKEKIIKIYSHDIEVESDTEAFQFENGLVIHTGGSGKSEAFEKVVERIVMFPINLPDNEVGGLESTAFFEAEKPMIYLMLIVVK